MEHEVDHVDDDQLFEQFNNSYGNTTSNHEHGAKEEDDEFDQTGDDFEDDDGSDFCITPFAKKSLKHVTTKRKKKTSLG